VSGPPPYSPVNDLAELCAVAVHRLTASAGDALRMRAVLLRLRDGLDIGLEDSRDPARWREAIDRRLREAIAELRAENERLRAELDAHRKQDGDVRIVPGGRAMLERVLAQPSSWQPKEGEVVRAAADGTQVTWRGGMWVLE